MTDVVRMLAQRTLAGDDLAAATAVCDAYDEQTDEPDPEDSELDTTGQHGLLEQPGIPPAPATDGPTAEQLLAQAREQRAAQDKAPAKPAGKKAPKAAGKKTTS